MKDELYALELLISKILRYGVILSGVLLLVGSIAGFQLTGHPYAAFHTYRTISLVDAVKDAIAHSRFGVLISYLGLVVLIALPFTRVLLTAILFETQKDRILAAVSFFVAAALIFSVCLGATGA